MSLDLTLLPFNSDFPENSFSHTLLPLQTNTRDLMEEIEKLSFEESNSIDFITGEKLSGEIPDNFSCFVARDDKDETCYGALKEDAYGKTVRWVRASVLQRLSNHDGVNRNPLNKQAWAYINACPPNTRVALYWN